VRIGVGRTTRREAILVPPVVTVLEFPESHVGSGAAPV
jgi:hypothetical protein